MEGSDLALQNTDPGQTLQARAPSAAAPPPRARLLPRPLLKASLLYSLWAKVAAKLEPNFHKAPRAPQYISGVLPTSPHLSGPLAAASKRLWLMGASRHWRGHRTCPVWAGFWRSSSATANSE